MTPSYKLTCISVNKLACLFLNQPTCNVRNMKYGERLKSSRELAKLTQVALAEKIGSGITQAGISYLEKGDATGSEFTVQFAVACGVRPEWLAEEKGEMIDGIYIEDVRIKNAVLILEQLKAEYRLDDALDVLNSITKLTRKASQEKK
jgi:transcriptional regulator with XRE-family HTH domain